MWAPRPISVSGNGDPATSIAVSYIVTDPGASRFMSWLRRILTWGFVVAVVAAIAFSFRPQPLDVDWETVSQGALEVTVNEDGRSRIREKYTVSTPLAGQLQRVVLNPGDPVVAGQTLLATILPTNPDLLDPRSRSSAEARVKAAEAGVKRSEATRGPRRPPWSRPVDARRRMKLRKGDATFEQAVEDAQMQARMRSEELRSPSSRWRSPSSNSNWLAPRSCGPRPRTSRREPTGISMLSLQFKARSCASSKRVLRYSPPDSFDGDRRPAGSGAGG